MEFNHLLSELLEGYQTELLRRDMAAVTDRYHTQSGQGKRLLTQKGEALAYACARMGATFTAVLAALEGLAATAPDFAPASVTDVGAGTGAASWAAVCCYSSIHNVTCLDREPAMMDMASWLMQRTDAPLRNADWILRDALIDQPFEESDLVVEGYMLNELAKCDRDAVVKRLWAATRGALVLVEPGTKAGYEVIRSARDLLTASGAHVAAPCAQNEKCPLQADDWCHFTRRVSRTRIQKQVKGGEAPYEDEHYAYIAFTREPCTPVAARILRHPQIRTGHVSLRVCTDGGAKDVIVSKKEGKRYKLARAAQAGDALT